MNFNKSEAQKKAWAEGRQAITPARIAAYGSAISYVNGKRWGAPAESTITSNGELTGFRFGICVCGVFEPLLMHDRMPFRCCDCRAEHVEQEIAARKQAAD
jgi:hypothetical protein